MKNKNYFLDSNFLIRKGDDRHTIFDNHSNFLITEHIYNEINKKGKKWKKILPPNRLNIIKFDDLRKKFPATCPVYYNFVQSMHSPANISSAPHFYANKNFAVKESNKLNEERKKFNQDLINRAYKGYESQINRRGEVKASRENYIDVSFLARFKKRRTIKNKQDSFFNDYKNLALILIYMLLNEEDVCFFTSDIDIFCDFYTWLDSMAHQLTLRSMILELIKEEDKEKLFYNNRKLVYFINFTDFKQQCDGLLNDLLLDNWKQEVFNFTIKYWDPKKQEFHNETLKFDKKIGNLILNNHGLFYCPFVANYTHGNFVRYLYYWPPTSIHDMDTLKVSVQLKRCFSTKNQRPWAIKHNKKCDHRKMEKRSSQRFLFQDFRISD